MIFRSAGQNEVMTSRLVKAVLAALVLALALVGCGSSEKDATPTKYTFGQTAKVSESLEITVKSVEAVQPARLARFGVKKTDRPYFVQVAVTNIGTKDLGNQAIPLYLQDAHNTLLTYSQVDGPFPDCPSQPFPTKFAHGSTLTTCLIYIMGQENQATLVSYRPDQTKEPITWSGTIIGQKSVPKS